MAKGGKVLVVTGELAESMVKKYSAESSVRTEVKTLPVSVATFLTNDLLIRELRGLEKGKYSLLMLPGLVRSDLAKVEREIGLPTYRGPKYAADIPLVLENLKKIKLSKKGPACELLKSQTISSAKATLKKIERDAKKLRSKPRNFTVGRGKSAVFAGVDFPARVIAEITDAPLLRKDQIIAAVKRHLGNGAEIIDIGMLAEKEMPQRVSELVSIIKEFDVPVSINTLSKNEIKAALDAGVDMVISVSGDTIEEFAGLDVPAVLVPINRKRRYFPHLPDEKIEYLLKLTKRAKELGYARVIADPIMEPVNMGFVESLMSFYELRRREPDIPILMGIGNVVELYDADSAGMVALLTGASSEIGASFLLTVEGSDKTWGNVAELRRARDMMTLARFRGSAPKDLGLDLLILKEKRRISDVFDERIEKGVRVVKARRQTKFKCDPQGSFKIFVDGSDIIGVLYRSQGSPQVVVKGKTAEEVGQEIVRRNLVSDLEHAAYLGRELQKAEIAIRTGRGYVQDKIIF